MAVPTALPALVPGALGAEPARAEEEATRGVGEFVARPGVEAAGAVARGRPSRGALPHRADVEAALEAEAGVPATGAPDAGTGAESQAADDFGGLGPWRANARARQGRGRGPAASAGGVDCRPAPGAPAPAGGLEVPTSVLWTAS